MLAQIKIMKTKTPRFVEIYNPHFSKSVEQIRAISYTGRKNYIAEILPCSSTSWELSDLGPLILSPSISYN